MAPEAADSRTMRGRSPSEDFSSILAAPALACLAPEPPLADGRQMAPKPSRSPLAREAGEGRREAPGEG